MDELKRVWLDGLEQILDMEADDCAFMFTISTVAVPIFILYMVIQ